MRVVVVDSQGLALGEEKLKKTQWMASPLQLSHSQSSSTAYLSSVRIMEVDLLMEIMVIVMEGSSKYFSCSNYNSYRWNIAEYH